MKIYDVVVIGGGPIGGFIAEKISKKGYQVLLYEEHKEIGAPLKCAGLISERVFDFINVSKRKVIENEIYGAHIHSPSENILTIGGNKKHAIVINRQKFDQEIINNAIKAGAQIKLESKAISAESINKHIQLSIKQNDKLKKIQSKLIIGADGPHSKIRAAFNFPKPVEFIHGIGAKAENTNLDPKYVEVFIGRKIAPGFFAWAIPTNKEGTEARIGLCIDNTSKYTLKECFNRLSNKKILKNMKITKNIAGTIPLGALKKTTDENVMIVGDAAAQVKPVSGGGIYPGLVCGKHCSNVAIDALEKNDFSRQNLNNYHRLWTKEIGREMMLGMKFRKIIKNIDDIKMDKYISKLNSQKNIEIMSRYGDIDFPSKLVFPLIKKNPSFIKLIPTALKKSKNI